MAIAGPATNVRLLLHKCWVWLLTFVAYALLHTTRKAFSNTKATLKTQWGDADASNGFAFFSSPDAAERFFGTMDGLFMFFYAVGLYMSGHIEDR